MSSHIKFFALPRPDLHHLRSCSSSTERRASQAHIGASQVVIEGIGTFPILPPRETIHVAMLSPPPVLRKISVKPKDKEKGPPRTSLDSNPKSQISLTQIGTHHFPEGLVKPPFLWRVTDSTSLTRIDEQGNFNTNCQLWGHWSFWTSVISCQNLSAQIDWYHRFTPTTASGTGDDPPLFVSVTADCSWAYDEFDRRARRRREGVRINVIDMGDFEWEVVFLDNGERMSVFGERMSVLRERETGCTVFSSEAAARALGWESRYRNRWEWFAIKWIPGRFVLPEVWGND